MAKTEVGARIRELRLKKLWSQERLAQKAGLSMNTISRIENGRYVPQDLTLERVARALGVDRKDLLQEAVA